MNIRPCTKCPTERWKKCTNTCSQAEREAVNECPKYKTCWLPCAKVELYARQDYVYQREKYIGRLIDDVNDENDYTPSEFSSYFHHNKLKLPFISTLQNKLLQLAFFEGLTYEEIAYRLSNQHQKVSTRKVKYLLCDAKERLRKHKQHLQDRLGIDFDKQIFSTESQKNKEWCEAVAYYSDFKQRHEANEPPFNILKSCKMITYSPIW